MVYMEYGNNSWNIYFFFNNDYIIVFVYNKQIYKYTHLNIYVKKII